MKRTNITIALLFSFLLFASSSIVYGQISITQLGQPYMQDFNTLSSTTTSTFMPAEWHFRETGSNADQIYAVSTGSSTGGNAYSFGATSNTERAFGGLTATTLDSVIVGAPFTNNTGSTITNLTVKYTGEQWRKVSGRLIPDTILFGYSTNATSLNSGSWTNVSNLMFLTPAVNYGGAVSAGALDGNASANKELITFTITGLNIANGNTIWLRWVDRDIAGTDDGMAIDDVEVTACGGTPTITLSGTATICPSSNTSLTASYNGGTPWEFTWTDGTVNTNVTGITNSTYSWSVTPSATTTYTAQSFNGPCGVPSPTQANVVVTVFTNTPTAVLSGTQTICNTGIAQLSVNFTGVAPFQFTWTDGVTPATLTNITSTSYVFSVTPSATTTFSLTAMSDNCQSGNASGTAIVSVDPSSPPTASLSGAQTVCAGSTASLTVALTNGTVWNFTYSDGTNNTTRTGITSSPHVFSVTPTANTTYTLTGVNNQTCNGSTGGTANVGVLSLPGATISQDSAICVGTSVPLSVTLTGSSPWSITYTEGTTPVTITGIMTNPYVFTSTPSVTTSYTLSSVSDLNCTATVSGSVVISVNPTPTASISGDQSICSGLGVILTVSLTGNQPWELSYSVGSTTLTETGITSSPYLISITPGASVTYTLLSVDNECPGTLGNSSAVVTVNTPPSASMSGSAAVCGGNSTAISVTLLSSSTPYSITYSDGTTSTTETGLTLSPFIFTVTPTASVTYTLTDVSDNSGCTGSAMGSAIIGFTPGSSASLSASQTICAGSSAALSIALSGSTPFQVVYSNGVGNTTINGITSTLYIVNVTPSATTTYSLVSVMGANCSGNVSGTAVVTVNPLPSPVISGTNTLTVSGITGTASYQWQLNGTDIAGATNNTHIPVTTGTYTLVVTQNDCSATSNSLSVTVSIDEDIISSRFTVYPNPTSGIINLTGDLDILEVWVSDAAGRIIYTSVTGDAQNIQIDLGNQTPGVYYLKVKTSQGMGHKMMIRN